MTDTGTVPQGAGPGRHIGAMNPTVRVHNGGPSPLVIDQAGHMLDPGAWAEVDLNDPVSARHLDAGRLKREAEPPPRAETADDGADKKPRKASSKDGEKE